MLQFTHLQQALAQYGDAIRDQYKDNLERDNRRATGNLITSINTKVNVNGCEFIIEMELEKYWEYVEWDTRPHVLPREAIDGTEADKPSLLQWVKAKRILPHPNVDKLPEEQAQLKIAWAVANKIAKEGTKGTHDLEDALYEVDYESILSDAFYKDIDECIDEILMFKL